MNARDAMPPCRASTIERPRLDAAFERALDRCRIVVVCASGGAGKSFAIASHLAAPGSPAGGHFASTAMQRSLATFARGLVDALGHERIALRRSFAAALTTAERSARPAATLAAWFADHLAGTPLLVALDDLHRVDDVPEIVAFVTAAIERSPANVRFVLGMRHTLAFPIASWLAAGTADVTIDERALSFAPDEAAALASALGSRVAPGIDGHARRLVLALTRVGAAHAVNAEVEAAQRVRDAVASFEAHDRTTLVALAALPSLDDATLASIVDARRVVAALERALPCPYEPAGGEIRFAEVVAAELDRSVPPGDAERTFAANVAVDALRAAGRTADALRVAIHQRLTLATAIALDHDGFALYDGGDGDLVSAAVASLEVEARRHCSIALVLEAMAESDLGRHDVAESWFSHAVDAAATPAIRARVKYALAGDLLRRERLDGIAILEEIVAGSMPSGLLAAALASLASGHAVAARWVAARARIAEALDLLPQVPDMIVRAGVYHRAAYVALQDGDAVAAERYAEHALALALEHGQDELVAVSLSVLYVVATTFRDDSTRALKLLERLEACGTRLGNAYFRCYALIGRVELYADRGDVVAMRRVQRRLASEELENNVRQIHDALLPTQALQSGWSGDFAAAHSMLVATAERSHDPQQRALRYAEVAVYAAAARRDAPASGAIRKAREALRDAPRLAGASLARANLYLALAATMLGRVRVARAALASTEASIVDGSRLAAFASAVRELILRRSGAANHEAVLATLAALYDADFGGVATMIGSLPGDRLGAVAA